MRFLNGKRIKDFVGRRELLLFVCSFLVTAAVTFVSNMLPVNISPNLALCPVIGLLFGPFAILGVDLVSLISNVSNGIPPEYCALDLVTVFLVSYIPYRTWYSTAWDMDDRPPVLDSVRNITKFVLVLLASCVTYTILYSLTYGMMDGTFALTLEDLSRFVNVMSFSFLFGMAAVLLLRYLGVQFYCPKFGGTPDDFRRRIDPRVYDLSLVIGLVFPLLVLNSGNDVAIHAVSAASYLMIALYLLKPVEHARSEESVVSYKGIRINKFNRNLIERIIVIFVVSGLMICLVFGAAAYMGVLSDVFGLGYDVSVLFYMSVGLLLFFIPALVFLWYIERNVTEPVSNMSGASKNFMVDGYGLSSEEFAHSCREYVEMDTEVGELARSLVKMTRDMETYVEDIRTLNNQQEIYRAELNVAKSIQESTLPRDFSVVDGTGVSVAASMEAAKYVGGDFYDFFMVDTDHIALIIGDVSGKGVPAALFMAVSKSLLEGHTRPGFRPDEVLSKANITLCKNNDENMFVSVWIGILELNTGVLKYSSAGHNPPIEVRSGSEPELLQSKQRMVLGARTRVQYETVETVLRPGDRVLLYTDGVTEANDHFEGFYGMDRLMGMLQKCEGMELQDQVTAINEDISGFTHGASQFDDITMLLFRYDGVSRSGEPLLDGEDVAVPVAPVADPVDVPLDKEDA